MALTKITGAGIGTVTNQFADANMAAGSVVQVVSNASDTVTTVTNGATTNIISQAITPSASSSKILIRASINLGGGLNSYGYCRLLRGTTAIGISTQASGSQVNASFQVMTKNWTYQSYRTSPHIFEFLDSPSTTSATTYHISMSCTSDNVYLNRASTLSTSDAFTPAVVSTLTLMEIAG